MQQNSHVRQTTKDECRQGDEKMDGDLLRVKGLGRLFSRNDDRDYECSEQS